MLFFYLQAYAPLRLDEQDDFGLQDGAACPQFLQRNHVFCFSWGLVCSLLLYYVIGRVFAVEIGNVSVRTTCCKVLLVETVRHCSTCLFSVWCYSRRMLSSGCVSSYHVCCMKRFNMSCLWLHRLQLIYSILEYMCINLARPPRGQSDVCPQLV